MNLSVRRSRLLATSLVLFAVAIVAANLVSARPPEASVQPISELVTPQRTSSTPATTTFAFPETTYFGGTVWAADSMRWEAIEGGTWTFESGVGSHFQHRFDSHKDRSLHAQMEGWTGLDFGMTSPGAGPKPGFFRRVSEQDFLGRGVSPCVGSSAGLGGDFSFWAGVLPEEADSLCYAAGMGYGNLWSLCIEKVFTYNGIGQVALRYDYSVDVEHSYDWVEAQSDTTVLTEHGVSWGKVHTGSDAGTVSDTLEPGAGLPMEAGPFVIRFCFTTDPGYSDEDGIYPTDCGAFAVDNIVLTGGGISDSSDFETGDDGWSVVPFLDDTWNYAGDWSWLAAVDDLPAPPESLDACDFGDSVLVFFDPAIQGHPERQLTLAVSPWIDLKRAGIPDSSQKFIELGGYFSLPLDDRVYVPIFLQWYPGDTCVSTGTPIPNELTFFGYERYWTDGPTCASGLIPNRIDIGDSIPSNVDAVRIALGVANWCWYYVGGCSGASNTTPWLDNIRFGVVTEGSTVGIPDDRPFPRQTLLGNPTPNPLMGLQAGRISFAVPDDQRAHVDVFDIAGRRVATIFSGMATKGWNEVQWSGKDERGRSVPRGIYFYRLVTADTVLSRKLVRL